MTEFDNDRLAEIQDCPFSTPTAEIEEWVETYGSERDALDIALAKIIELNAWIIAQERCPDCFGEVVYAEPEDENIDISYYECADCGSRWLHFGKKLPYA